MSLTWKSILGIALACGMVGTAEAEVSVFTPALWANSSGQTVCRVSNTDTQGQFVVLQRRNGFNGSVLSSVELALGAGETEDLAGTGYNYCEAVANTATIADKLVLSISVRDGNDNATGALQGARILTGSGAVQRTAGIEVAQVDAFLSCHVVNVGTTSQTVTIKILDDVRWRL